MFLVFLFLFDIVTLSYVVFGAYYLLLVTCCLLFIVFIFMVRWFVYYSSFLEMRCPGDPFLNIKPILPFWRRRSSDQIVLMADLGLGGSKKPSTRPSRRIQGLEPLNMIGMEFLGPI